MEVNVEKRSDDESITASRPPNLRPGTLGTRPGSKGTALATSRDPPGRGREDESGSRRTVAAPTRDDEPLPTPETLSVRVLTEAPGRDVEMQRQRIRLVRRLAGERARGQPGETERWVKMPSTLRKRPGRVRGAL